MKTLARAAAAALAFFVPLDRPGPAPAVGAEPARELLRSGVGADGRVTGGALAERSGWRVVRGFAWSVEVEDPARPGTFAGADAGQTFRHGQTFRVRVEAFCDLYLYVLVRNADGTDEVLVPADAEAVPFVRRGEVSHLPDLRFAPPAGVERLRLIASPRPLPWVAKGEIFEVANGFELNAEEEAALNNLKDIASRRDHVARGRVAPVTPAGDLAAVVRGIGEGRVPKGAGVFVDQRARGENLVVLTSPDPDSRAVVVHEVELKHGG